MTQHATDSPTRRRFHEPREIIVTRIKSSTLSMKKLLVVGDMKEKHVPRVQWGVSPISSASEGHFCPQKVFGLCCAGCRDSWEVNTEQKVSQHGVTDQPCQTMIWMPQLGLRLWTWWIFYKTIATRSVLGHVLLVGARLKASFCWEFFRAFLHSGVGLFSERGLIHRTSDVKNGEEPKRTEETVLFAQTWSGQCAKTRTTA